MSEIRVSFRLSSVNGFFIRGLARAYVRVDGTEYPADWKTSTAIPVGSGRHRVEAYLKYKGLNSELGRAADTVSLSSDSSVADVVARGSWLNNVPFSLNVS